MKRICPALEMVVLLLLLDGIAAANPPEVNGFRGTVTGTVKSAMPNGLSFVLTISEAKADPKYAATNDGSQIIGKDVTLGVRTPVVAPGSKVTAPAPDDVAFIKTLKVGMKIHADIFSVFKSPNLMRIQKPGKILDKQSPGSAQ